MGHKLLGDGLPATRNWQKVIALLEKTDNPGKVADATSRAAQLGLELAKKGRGVAHVILGFMDTVWCSRRENFRQGLADLGMRLPAEASLLDVVGAFDDALDRSLKDESGKLLYQAVRYEPKDFRQRRA